MAGAGGRIRADLFTNKAGNGAPTFQKGVVITGVTTSTSFKGSGAELTNLNATQLASGTVPAARLPDPLPAISGENLTNLPPSGDSNDITACLFI